LPKRHTPETLTNLLAKSSGNLAAITQRSQQLNKLNSFLVKTVGDTIAQNCRVSNYDRGVLTIETANSAFATRLNFMLADILSNFRQNVLPELANITLKVVPNNKFLRQEVKKKAVNNNQISKQAASYILEAASHAPDSLKRKLERLAALQKKE
jgi:hypothetical protein